MLRGLAGIFVLALVPVAGAVAGGVLAIAITWIFIDDPLAIALVGFGLLLAMVPTGAIVAAWIVGDQDIGTARSLEPALGKVTERPIARARLTTT